MLDKIRIGSTLLYCGCDQVGTLKILTDANGKLVKEIVRDSFGVRISDSRPDLYIPIGFGGGLEDPGTGLVHFGYRDYDPNTGRFTAKDPLGDTGGDHDLYEYCVDDPVSMNDSTGLLPFLAAVPPLVAFIGGKLFAAGLAYSVSRAITGVIDLAKGTNHVGEMDRKVLPYLGMSVAAGAAPGVAALTPGAAVAAGTLASQHPDKIVRGIDFADGFLTPGTPPPSLSGSFGGIGSFIYDEIQKRR